MEEWSDQGGVVARRQLCGGGLTPAQARRHVESGRWRRLHPGVYATHTGPVGDLARVWAALLYAGEAAAGHDTALWLHGVTDRAPELVDVCVPAERRVRAQPGLRIHHCRRWTGTVHPAARPPRRRAEIALLDTTDTAISVQAVVDPVLRATQRRITTAGRLRAELGGRPRHRWRGLLLDLLADVDDGVASPLERRFRQAVERRHRLPGGQRNAPEAAPGPGVTRWYRDVRYPAFGVVVELDGREAHPGHEAFRDRRRDNRAAERHEVALRYGWLEVAGDPCGVAAQLGAVLRGQGWPGRPVPCCAGCRAHLPGS